MYFTLPLLCTKERALRGSNARKYYLAAFCTPATGLRTHAVRFHQAECKEQNMCCMLNSLMNSLRFKSVVIWQLSPTETK